MFARHLDSAEAVWHKPDCRRSDGAAYDTPDPGPVGLAHRSVLAIATPSPVATSTGLES